MHLLKVQRANFAIISLEDLKEGEWNFFNIKN